MSKLTDTPADASYQFQRSFATKVRGRILRGFPKPVKRGLRLVVYGSIDFLDSLLGRRKDLVPPRHLNFAGDGNFEATGNEFLQYFVALGGLKPSDRVIEIGSGVGRMARPLTAYLSSGTYEGIDIVPEGIRWCQQNLSSRYPNFRFQLANVYNKMYNPGGGLQANAFTFPFADRDFDFAFLTSVFTHMLRTDMEHYLSEVARVLRPDGRCLITFFLLNDDTRELYKTGNSSLDFRFARDGCFVDDERVPEHAVAFEESYIRDIFRRLGFEVDKIRYGAWSGRAEHLSYQDIVIGRKVR